ncbi:hypothetical protein Syun_009547 [Stephania yunnanensis]|uniref:Uncharacterized protein n=1 Tax=Stephania yunnanensis TaxID=152371 RepID=A0AAP0PNN1_9MAGN
MDGASHGGGADLWLHSSGEARIAETAREKRRKDDSAVTLARLTHQQLWRDDDGGGVLFAKKKEHRDHALNL